MLVLVLAIAIATAGSLIASTGGHSPGQTARLVFHVGTIAGLTTALAFILQFAAGLSPWLMGGWFVVLSVIYGCHAVGVRNWGAPMSRAVLLFALGKFAYFARTQVVGACAGTLALAMAFGAGWLATRFDFPAAKAAQVEFDLIATFVLIGCAAIPWRIAHLTARTDLVLGLLLDGHGPMPGPPPYDPSLEPRAGHRGAKPTRRANVVVFVVDSLRARNMSAYGYERATTPFVDALISKRGACAVPLAVTNSPSTEAALWTVLSSRRVRHHAVNAPCLHDILRAAGYSVRFFLSGCHRHWMGLDALYGTDHDEFVDLLIDEQLVGHAEKLPRHGAAQGNFIFFHLMSPHGASGHEPSVVWTPARNHYNFAESDDLDSAARERMVNHYDNTVLQADGYLARLFEVLKARGFLDDAVVVITGDHGEALADRIPVMIGHGRGMFQESIQVPMIIWDSAGGLPQPAPMADHTDIAPTLLTMLGIEPPPAWQGMSIWSTPPRQAAHIEHIAHRIGRPPTQMEAVIAMVGSETFKTMRYRQAGAEILRRTFCLSSDPEENRDVTGELSGEIEAELERLLRLYHAQPAIAFATTWKYLDRHQNHRAESSAVRNAIVCPPEPV